MVEDFLNRLEQEVLEGQLQRLYAIQESDFVLNNDGSRIRIEHAYHRGEYEENKRDF